ncbi:DedA family protein [Candidatus Gracilibacteria bacterium]|nr:DedA family protein [Candidatus Gracilibacteria bacterium]
MKKVLDIVMKTLIALTFGLAIIALVKPSLMKDFIDWIRDIVLALGNWNYLVVFVSSIIESFPVLGVVIPGQNIMLISGGFFGEQGTSILIRVIALACVGALIGNYVGYLLGKYYGKDFFKEYGMWFGIGETEVKYLEKGTRKWGAWGVILAKFHNLARAFVPFIAGSTGMKHKEFVVYNIIGSIIYSVTIILLGVVFAKYYEIVLQYVQYIFIAIFVLIGVYIWKFKKKEFIQYMHEKNQEVEAKMNKKG